MQEKQGARFKIKATAAQLVKADAREAPRCGTMDCIVFLKVSQVQQSRHKVHSLHDLKAYD